MAALKLWLAAALLLPTAANAAAQTGGLFAQSAQASLERVSREQSDASRLSWLVIDVRTGQLLASRWADVDRPIAMGSLTKPFVALAYARTHTGYPRLNCAGTASRCWLPRGHGTITFHEALTLSCNSYFLQLASQTSSSALRAVTRHYGLPDAPASPAQWIGLEPTWRIAPLDLARAFTEMAIGPEPAAVRNGMRQAALTGTARALAAENALAKTGTAPCLRDCVASGDGFVVALTPSENPRVLLLVRERGTTGAATAAVAAHMLHALREDHVLEY